MSWGAIGAFLVVLVVIFLVGNAWFHLVESILGRVKQLLSGNRPPEAWHPLPPDWEDAGDDQHRS